MLALVLLVTAGPVVLLVRSALPNSDDPLWVWLVFWTSIGAASILFLVGALGIFRWLVRHGWISWSVLRRVRIVLLPVNDGESANRSGTTEDLSGRVREWGIQGEVVPVPGVSRAAEAVRQRENAKTPGTEPGRASAPISPYVGQYADSTEPPPDWPSGQWRGKALRACPNCKFRSISATAIDKHRWSAHINPPNPRAAEMIYAGREPWTSTPIHYIGTRPGPRTSTGRAAPGQTYWATRKRADAAVREGVWDYGEVVEAAPPS